MACNGTVLGRPEILMLQSGFHRLFRSILAPMLLGITLTISAANLSAFADGPTICTGAPLRIVQGLFDEAKVAAEPANKCDSSIGSVQVSQEALGDKIRMHELWLKTGNEGERANLCGADLPEIDLSGKDLRGIDLRFANLSGANLNDANLSYSWLVGANLGGATMHRATLHSAQAHKVDLSGVDGTCMYLGEADLSEAKLGDAPELNGSRLFDANLQSIESSGLQCEGCLLHRSKLAGATLNHANFKNAELNYAVLKGALLDDVSFENAWLRGVDFSAAVSFRPESYAPRSDLADLTGIGTVTADDSQPSFLFLVRKIARDSGLYDIERQTTTAIERAKTSADLADGSIWRKFVGVIRIIAFDLTTSYGTTPERSLAIVIVAIPLFALVYLLSIRRALTSPESARLFIVEPEKRIVMAKDGCHVLGDAAQILDMKGTWSKLVAHSLNFSLLSTFYFGLRDMNVADWLSRLQHREFSYSSTGWVRVVSGAQSLMSLYLLTIWALTQFGRPFD